MTNGKIYQYQSNLLVTLTVDVDMTHVASAVIKAKNSAETLTWTATVNKTAKTISYLIDDNTTLAALGTWTLWGVLTYEDDTKIPSSPITFTVKEEGKY